jgi:hypothetical protein
VTPESLFAQARQLPEAEWAAFLNRACPDADLRARVLALLAAEQTRDRAEPQPPETVNVSQEQSTGATGPYLPTLPAEAPTIPGYRITQEIAKGGMGRVYAAIDLSLDREVAIKTLLPGANAERFVTEAKITAKLPHPSIPPVHALGTLDDGTPWPAMKRIHGQTLASLLASRRRQSSGADDLSRYIQIFEQIAQAVGLAHSRGILHRDLKPLNVMVGELGEVQVMDWGLAKDTTSRGRQSAGDAGDGLEPDDSRRRLEEDNVHHTAAGTVMGTPGYMAPEQARGEVVDARADVFALGSILAAILTGKPAFVGTTARETISKAAAADLADVQARLEACGADAELPAIARRCLAAQPEDRFADGREVASAVAAYRAAVEARLRQAETAAAEALVREAEQRRRRRLAVTLGGGIAAVLLVGLAVSLWQMHRAIVAEGQAKANEQRAVENAEKERLAKVEAEEQRRQAEAAAEKERLAKEAETRERQYAQAIAAFVKDDFLALTSLEGQDRFGGQGLDRNTTLLDLLHRGAAKLRQRKDLDPRIEAELSWIIGVNYRGAGEAAKGVPFLERAVALRRQLLGAEHEDTLNATNSLAVCYSAAGKLEEALPLLEETLQLRKAKLGADHPLTLASMASLAEGYSAAGKLEEALPLYEEAAQGLEKRRFQHEYARLIIPNTIRAYEQAKQFEKAEAWRRKWQAHVVKARAGADSPAYAGELATLALNLLQQQKWTDAETILRECLAIREKNNPIFGRRSIPCRCSAAHSSARRSTSRPSRSCSRATKG